MYIKSRTSVDERLTQKMQDRYSCRRWRFTGWLTIAVQLALPLSVSFTPVLAAVDKQNAIPTTPYVLGQGETPSSVANKHNLTLDELQKLNVFRSFKRPFASLGTGDEIDIPQRHSPFSIDRINNIPSLVTEDRLSRAAGTAGSLLSSANSGEVAATMARSAVTGETNKSVEQWLSQYGTARVQLNLDEKMNLDKSSADVLVPLAEKQNSMIFTQLGIRNNDSRNTVNIGVGGRVIYNDWMYGVNTFYDYDITGQNRRLGVGTEAWTDYLKLSANGYLGLTDWHQSRNFADYNERPANGYDVRAEAYLPAYPQLGGKLMFEQYHGDEVALFGKNNRQKDPYALTVGLSYTPIPLVTLGADYRSGRSGQNDSNIGLQFNYRLGEPWQSQIDPSAVAGSRTLAGSRYDLVERNNNIVLDYQKQQQVRLSLPEAISGEAGSTTTVAAQVTATQGLKNIDWDSSALAAAGGALIQTSATTVALTLPPYRTGNNVHLLSAVAYDANGNASERAVTYITVQAQETSVVYSQTTATPNVLFADGVSTSQIVVNLRDGDNRPIAGQAAQLSLALEFSTGTASADSTRGRQTQVQLGEVIEGAAGEYSVTLTTGTQLGDARIAPVINGLGLDTVHVALVASSLDATQSGFAATPTTIIADDMQASTLLFSAKDANGNAVSGLDVAFEVSNVTGTTVSDVTETNGGYSATLTGTTSGTAIVKPMINGTAMGSLSAAIELNPGSVDSVQSTLTAERSAIVANGSDKTTLRFTAKDSYGNAISGLNIAFVVSGVTDTIINSTMAESDGVYSAKLTGTTTGVATVAPRIDGVVVPGLNVELTLSAPAALTGISVNGANFDINSGFPKMAFEGATFQLQANGSVANNNKFNWSSDNEAVDVDQNGNITINDATSSNVTIELSDKVNPFNTTKFSFKLNEWFINNSSTRVEVPEADAWCAAQGNGYSTPNNTQITIDFAKRNAAGGLIDSWGRMGNYSLGWTNEYYWLSNINTNGNRAPISFIYGWTLVNDSKNSEHFTTCVRKL